MLFLKISFVKTTPERSGRSAQQEVQFGLLIFPALPLDTVFHSLIEQGLGS